MSVQRLRAVLDAAQELQSLQSQLAQSCYGYFISNRSLDLVFLVQEARGRLRDALAQCGYHWEREGRTLTTQELYQQHLSQFGENPPPPEEPGHWAETVPAGPDDPVLFVDNPLLSLWLVCEGLREGDEARGEWDWAVKELRDYLDGGESAEGKRVRSQRKKRDYKEAMAVGLLYCDRSWADRSNKDIASALGCHVKSIPRWETFNALRELIRQGRPLPRRRKSGNDAVEG